MLPDRIETGTFMCAIAASGGAARLIDTRSDIVGAVVDKLREAGAQVETGEGAPGIVLDEALKVACGAGAVRILELQRAGRQPMQTREFLRGLPLAPGTRLS